MLIIGKFLLMAVGLLVILLLVEGFIRTEIGKLLSDNMQNFFESILEVVYTCISLIIILPFYPFLCFREKRFIGLGELLDESVKSFINR